MEILHELELLSVEVLTILSCSWGRVVGMATLPADPWVETCIELLIGCHGLPLTEIPRFGWAF